MLELALLTANSPSICKRQQETDGTNSYRGYKIINQVHGIAQTFSMTRLISIMLSLDSPSSY